MKNIKPILHTSLPDSFVGVGVINATKSSSRYYGVEVLSPTGMLETLAYKADGLTTSIAVGDRVLCVASAEKTLYITMLLECSSQVDDAVSALNINTPLNEVRSIGARVENVDQSGVYKTYNKRSELIFEYDSTSDRSRVIVDAKSLDIGVPKGDINLSAGGQIKFDSRTIAMSAGDQNSQQKTNLFMTQFSANLHSSLLNVKSRNAKLDMVETHFSGQRFFSKITEAKLLWGKVEVLADKLVGKFKSRFTSVDELDQLKAGRVRNLVVGSYRVKAERMNLKTDKSVNIDGERINLG